MFGIKKNEEHIKASTSKQKKILLIDDDEDIWKIIGRLVGEEHNLRCLPYLDAWDSIYTKDYTPDLVIIDINLGEQNGFKIARELRGIFPSTVPIIYISANKDYRRYYEKTNDKNSFFIAKPFENSSLQLTLHSFLKE